MDLYFQGVTSFNKEWTPENLAEARVFFERSLALDPENIEALTGAAMVDSVVAASFMVDDRAARLATAEAALTKVLLRAPNHARAHFILGNVQVATNRALQGIAECERALALDRNLAHAHGCIGFAKFIAGRGEEAEAHVQEALRLSPRDTYANLWLAFAGFAKLALGADEEAVAWFRRSIEAHRNFPPAYFYLAAALAQLHRLEEARTAVEAGLALHPDFTTRRYRAGAFGDNPIYLAQRERIYDGMRKAGVPEG